MNKLYVIKVNKIFIIIIFFIILISSFILIDNSFNSNSIDKAAYNAANATQPKLAIIIDDFGQNREGVKEMLSIKRHLTIAVMPFLTFSREDALNAYKNGHEVIVHLPMESIGMNKSWLGPKPILTVMSKSEIQQLTMDSINSIPFAKGVNIHMGSKAGDDKRVISDILDVVKLKKLYFVDSRASLHPVANEISKAKGVVCFDRDVFIDKKNKDKNYIKKQLELAADIAVKKGYSVAIGHVGIEGGRSTAEAINEKIPDFDIKGIKLVFVSELME